MATSILSIGQSALAAAQVGLSTTGHNIANAATPGYNRQVAVQGAAQAQSYGFGFMGQGTEISTVKRIYSEFLGAQVNTAQSTKSALDSYSTQIQRIDNMLGDPTSGLSPALQGFFSGMQEMASNPSSIPSRQAALSSAETLASRFQSMAGRLQEIEQGVNSQVTSSVNVINSYAQQIAKLNDAISLAQGASGKPPNDLLDQRDQLVLDLNKEIKATVVKQGDGGYNIFIGSGQPLVVGVKTFGLTTAIAPSDPQKLEVAYQTAGGNVIVGASSLGGGKLGGLLEFRSKTLEPAQQSLDDLATGLAATFNAQHRLGQDLDGNLGGDFFTVTAGTGAAGFAVAIGDPRQIAAAAPIRTAVTTGNIGSGAISAGSVNTPPPPDANLQQPVTITFTSATTFDVTGTGTGNPTGLPYTPGETITYNGWSFTISGAPADTDTFTVGPNAGGVGDNRNALLLTGLQTANAMGGTSYQGAYSQLVSEIGNKSRELQVTGTAAGLLLSEATTSLQNESGVNLDEEATNLLRYQQAYQAAGKVMQIASQMFDVLLSLGR
ncbi:MAG TPA: flagellar hook-associated protein FlgK [Thiobacillus sp.]|nr:MAG: flagellar hook-associated protein FlgK [Hydrogenophilales bacterium 16-64-40]OZA33711.1 MAG: flagellar hook-associated protein FlgK [Hydrogenophilales bacterium 17-64-65]HQS81984.1 flagellar hook-associated protein FlgK [Thiobacillus sp.]HQT34141.1 flagellar hook-associated protein FlgK [Thiobacillus sp.]